MLENSTSEPKSALEGKVVETPHFEHWIWQGIIKEIVDSIIGNEIYPDLDREEIIHKIQTLFLEFFKISSNIQNETIAKKYGSNFSQEFPLIAPALADYDPEIIAETPEAIEKAIQAACPENIKDYVLPQQVFIFNFFRRTRNRENFWDRPYFDLVFEDFTGMSMEEWKLKEKAWQEEEKAWELKGSNRYLFMSKLKKTPCEKELKLQAKEQRHGLFKSEQRQPKGYFIRLQKSLKQVETQPEMTFEEPLFNLPKLRR